MRTIETAGAFSSLPCSGKTTPLSRRNGWCNRRAAITAALAFVTVAGATAWLGVAFELPARLAAYNLPSTAVTAETAAERQALYLARSTLLSLHHANLTGDYGVMRSLTAPAFQAANSSEKLTRIFSEIRRRRLDLSVAALSQPNWIDPPWVGSDGHLRLKGLFPVAGGGLAFEIGYMPVEGHWRVMSLSVAMQPVQTAQR